MRKIRRQIYCLNGWQCNALSCDVSLILILPGPMWWWCCAVVRVLENKGKYISSSTEPGQGRSWTLQWMVLAANSFYLAIDPNMMLLNTILFIDTHHSLISPHTQRCDVIYMEEAVGCGVGHWPLQLTLFTSLFRWTPHFLLHQLARQ